MCIACDSIIICMEVCIHVCILLSLQTTSSYHTATVYRRMFFSDQFAEKVTRAICTTENLMTIASVLARGSELGIYTKYLIALWSQVFSGEKGLDKSLYLSCATCSREANYEDLCCKCHNSCIGFCLGPSPQRRRGFVRLLLLS